MVATKEEMSEWLSLQLSNYMPNMLRNRRHLISIEMLKELDARECGVESIETSENEYFVIKYDGFPDKLIIFLDCVHEGIRIGYIAVKWHGPANPVMTKIKKHLVSWEDFEGMDLTERHAVLLERLLKTVRNRKRQYRKCHFCGERTATEHRFDESICHSCATEHFHIDY